MSNNLPDNLIPIPEDPRFKALINSTKDCTKNISQKKFLPENFNVPHIMSNEEYQKPITEKIGLTNEILEIQNEKLEDFQKQLNKFNFELKQANDKLSSQNLYIKELKAELKEEIKKRKLFEDKISKKDKILSIISLISAIIGGIIVVIFENVTFI